MKSAYSVRVGNKLAILDVMPAQDTWQLDPEMQGDIGLGPPGAWYISRINVPHHLRGQGLGTALLRQVCEDADREHIDLTLTPVPDGDSDMGFFQLEQWYARYGFVWLRPTKSGRVLMVRKCR